MPSKAKKKDSGIPVRYSLQTNGLLLDEEWADFLHEHDFLVGLSLDGIRKTHDRYRKSESFPKTHSLVLEKAKLLKEHHVDFNILTVVTRDVAENMREIYSFYQENSLSYQQYIPCMEPLSEEKKLHDYSLSAEDYLVFLNDLFDLYYEDITKGRYIYNRYFENILGLILGNPPENCAMSGSCSVQYVIEGNGNVYPCDFYAMDDYLLGNILTDDIRTLDKKRMISGFLNRNIPSKCLICPYGALCRGGCKRDRIRGELFYCRSYYQFFERNLEKLKILADLAYEGKFPKP